MKQQMPPVNSTEIYVVEEHLRPLPMGVKDSTVSIIRAVSMTIRFGTASSAIPLDFIDMYCFEYPINLRYSRGVLNNISIKEYTQPLRPCGCALVCANRPGTSNSSPKARKKQESSPHFHRCQSQTPKYSKKGMKSTLILVRLRSSRTPQKRSNSPC